MADHLHKQIRAALVAKLTGLTTTGSRVYANRLQPLPDAMQPTLLVTLDEERADVMTIGIVTYDRTLDAVVTAVAKASSALDDTLDQMSKEVETALATGITVGGRVLDCLYSGMSFEDEFGDKPAGAKRMTFSINFTAPAATPDTLA